MRPDPQNIAYARSIMSEAMHQGCFNFCMVHLQIMFRFHHVLVMISDVVTVTGSVQLD